ncbi:MAG: hypothetical protein D3918_06600 [Candidatus Electrothrix sp. AX2]|nr:hypothetical protein [Candidatus Electrothrix gigas]
MNSVNNWIEHLQHPLVLAGFGLFIFALLLRPLFLNNKKLSGTAIERLLSKGMILVFILALLAIIGGVALNWKPSTSGNALTIEQYRKDLLEQYERYSQEKQKREEIEQKLIHLEESYQKKQQLLKESQKKLQQMVGVLPKEQLNKAEKQLAQGKTELAEQLFDRVAEETGQAAAQALLQSGRLAEDRLDYAKAMRQYKKAVALDENNPDYLLTAVRMACTLADYDRAQEWLTKMPNDMSNDQIFDFIDLSIELLHDTGRYREINELIVINLGFKALQRKIDWKIGIENVLWIGMSRLNLKRLAEANVNLDLSSPETLAEANVFISSLDLSSPESLTEIFVLELFNSERSPETNAFISRLDSGLKEVGYSPQAFLRSMEKRLGREHPKVAQFYNNFALFYLSHRDYKEAAPLIQRALKIKEKTLGKNHPSMAVTLNNLALMHILQEHYDEAESLYQRSLNIVSKSFGNDHPQVAAALNNLAELYKIQGRDEEANSLHQRAAAIQKAGNDKKTTALFQRIVSILSNNFEQARYDDLKRKITEQ